MSIGDERKPHSEDPITEIAPSGIEQLDDWTGFSREEWNIIVELKEKIFLAKKICDETQNKFVWDLVRPIFERITVKEDPNGIITRDWLILTFPRGFEKLATNWRRASEDSPIKENPQWQSASPELQSLVREVIDLAQELKEKLEQPPQKKIPQEK